MKAVAYFVFCLNEKYKKNPFKWASIKSVLDRLESAPWWTMRSANYLESISIPFRHHQLAGAADENQSSRKLRVWGSFGCGREQGVVCVFFYMFVLCFLLL